MERRYRTRLNELLDDAVVRPSLLRGVLPRLVNVLDPFVDALLSPEQRLNAQDYVEGLLSEATHRDRNTPWSIDSQREHAVSSVQLGRTRRGIIKPSETNGPSLVFPIRSIREPEIRCPATVSPYVRSSHRRGA